MIKMNIMEYVESLSDVCGVADFQNDNEKLVETYGEDISIYPYAIVIGHKLNEEIIEKIPLTYNDDDLAQEYLDEYYNSFKRISKITDKIKSFIEDENYHAIVLSATEEPKEITLKRSFSNKTSANIAGVGWLGKNNLLTTREFGPRLTWATILTDAPLKEYVGHQIESLCGDCQVCVNACPGGAIVNLSDPEKSYSPQKCGEYIMGRKEEGHPTACGMCLYICPYGNDKVKNLI